MVSAVLFITFFVLLVLNVPISICLGLSSAAAILYSGTSLTIVATNIYSGISKFLLLAIPFFVLSGNIMAKAGISTRLIRFVDTCVTPQRRHCKCMYHRCLLLRRDLRFRSCNGSSFRRSSDPGYGRKRRLLRSILYCINGNCQLHCHCHPAKYCLRCVCFHYRRFHW